MNLEVKVTKVEQRRVMEISVVRNVIDKDDKTDED